MSVLIRFVLIIVIGITLTACPKITYVDVFMNPISDNEKEIIPYSENQKVKYISVNGNIIDLVASIKMDTFVQYPVKCGMAGGGERPVYHYYQYQGKLKPNINNDCEIVYGLTNLKSSFYYVRILKDSVTKSFYFSKIDSLNYYLLSNFQKKDSILFIARQFNDDKNKTIHDTVFLHRKKGIIGWSFEDKERWFLKE